MIMNKKNINRILHTIIIGVVLLSSFIYSQACDDNYTFYPGYCECVDETDVSSATTQEICEAMTCDDESSEEIDTLIVARNDARANKDWAKADEIRAKLDEMDVVLEDTQSGTIWKRKQ